MGMGKQNAILCLNMNIERLAYPRTQYPPAGRGRGGMKTVARAAAALCCAGAEARVRSPGAERRMLAAGAALARTAGGGGRRRGEGRRGTNKAKQAKQDRRIVKGEGELQ